MISLDRFLERRIDQLLTTYLAGKEDAPLPIDLEAIAKASGVLSVEEREMIPEAVMTTEGTGYRIWVQSNFIDAPGARIRRRFSLAHEIAHTFFYEVREGVLAAVPKAPTGKRLEAACHLAAGMLLAPSRFLLREVKQRGLEFGAEDIVPLSQQFDVSVEVILRRLQELRVFENPPRTPILVRVEDEKPRIEYAIYTSWLKSILPSPTRGEAFATWFHGKNASDEMIAKANTNVIMGEPFSRRAHDGRLYVRPLTVSKSVRIIELRLGD